MSHYYMTVLVPKDGLPENPMSASAWTDEACGNLRTHIEKLMARYDENKDVTPYTEECFCVGVVAKRSARETAEKAVPVESVRYRWRSELLKRYPDLAAKMERSEWDQLRARYMAKEEDQTTTDEEHILDTVWDECIQEHKDAAEAAYKAHVLCDEPDPECEECNGTGTRETTYNPDSRWDWYVVGGRWDGAVSKARGKCNDNGTLHKNVVTVKWALENWDDDDVPLALLTPDGEWHERGKLGMFATYVCPPHAPHEWRAAARRILEYHPDCLIVGIDCHI